MVQIISNAVGKEVKIVFSFQLLVFSLSFSIDN